MHDRRVRMIPRVDPPLLGAGALVPSLLHAQAVAHGSWSTRAPLSIKLSEVAVTAANGKIYVIGGSTPDIVDLRLNQEYDPATDRWRERAPLPRGLTHAAATALNNRVYVIGAFTAAGHGAATDAVFEYDPASDAWRTIAPLESPRGSVGVTVLDGKIHAVGGRGVDKVTVVTHEVYDPASGKMEQARAATESPGPLGGSRGQRTHSCDWRTTRHSCPKR